MSNGRYTTALHNYFQGRNECHLLSWKESHAGPANDLTWTAECKVGGRALAVGTGGQLRIAKEKAAQKVCNDMGIPA